MDRIDDLRGQFERHEVPCRQPFYELVGVLETDVAQILSKSSVAPPGFLEDATVALELIRKECKCTAAQKKG